MSILGSIKRKGERKKARSFYLQMPKLKGDPREVRKLRSLMSARLTAFIDTTFIEGAKKTESFQDSQTPLSTLKLETASYKNVKTLGGIVCVYMPSKMANYFFELGSLYQRANLTINQVLELADEMCVQISTSLYLDPPIHALNFLRAESEEDDKASPKDGHQEHESTDNQKTNGDSMP